MKKTASHPYVAGMKFALIVIGYFLGAIGVTYINFHSAINLGCVMGMVGAAWLYHQFSSLTERELHRSIPRKGQHHETQH